MIPPWVIEEIRSHPYRMWLIQAIGLVVFTLILVYQMPANDYTVNVYSTKSPRAESSTAVESKGIAVSKKDGVRPSRAPRDTAPDPVPTRPGTSARSSPSPSEPSEPAPGPSDPSEPPSEPTTPPDDQGPPVTPPNDPKPDTGGPKTDNPSTDSPKQPQRVNIHEANEFGPRTK